jgi:hypothetical protein
MSAFLSWIQQTNVSYGFWLILIALVISQIGMLVDCVRDKVLTVSDKVMWVCVILFAPAMGCMAYYLLVKTKRPTRTV